MGPFRRISSTLEIHIYIYIHTKNGEENIGIKIRSNSSFRAGENNFSTATPSRGTVMVSVERGASRGSHGSLFGNERGSKDPRRSSILDTQASRYFLGELQPRI